MAVTAAGNAIVASMKRRIFSVHGRANLESAYAASGFTVSDARTESTTSMIVFAKDLPLTKR